MSRGVNKVILLGYLGQDPTIRYSADGKAMANISIATNEEWKTKEGEKQSRTEWHRIVMWGRLAEIAGEYLKKGAQVYIEGKICTRKWKDKSGQDRYITEIVADEMQMLGKRDDAGTERAAQQQPEKTLEERSQEYAAASGRSAAAGKAPGTKPARAEFDDEIPF